MVKILITTGPIHQTIWYPDQNIQLDENFEIHEFCKSDSIEIANCSNTSA